MKSIKLTALMLLALIVIISAAGCTLPKSSREGVKNTAADQTGSSTPDAGKLTGSVYTNAYFGLTVRLPKDWSIQDADFINKMTEKGKEAVAGDDQKLKDAVDAGVKNTIYMLAAYKYPVTQQTAFNPSIMTLAEKVPASSGINTSVQYLQSAQKLMMMSQVAYNFYRDIYVEKVGGVEFGVLEAKVDLHGTVITQRYYASLKKGYALCFIESYSTDGELSELNGILSSVSFAE